MERSVSQLRRDERKVIHNITHSSTSNIELDKDTLKKLLFRQSYTKEDIIKCAEKLLQKYGLDFQKQFGLLENLAQLDAVFEKFTTGANTPLFVIYGESNNLWVLFCLIRDQKFVTKILYKNPCGDVMDQVLQEKIKEKFPQSEFVFHQEKDFRQDDDFNYGPVCLRNLSIFLESLKSDPIKCVDTFTKIEFYSPRALTRDKFEKVLLLTDEIARNKAFRKSLNDLVEKLPLRLSSNIKKYSQVLKEELEKDENNLDFNRIHEFKKIYLNKDDIEKLLDNYTLNTKKTGSVGNYELDIQTDFPDEMEKLQYVLEALQHVKVDEAFLGVLHYVCKSLRINEHTMQALYALKIQEDNEADQKSDDIEEITKELPKRKRFFFNKQIECRTFDQLVSEVSLGIDKEEYTQQLKDNYRLVKEMCKKWDNSDIKSIYDWSAKMKGNLVDGDIFETIAIIDRALNLLTGSLHLRDTQILAVLVFCLDQGGKGTLCQIKDGEGKTLIVLIMAVIKVLQGHTVDVITNSPMSATQEVDQTKTFYSIFNATVATNNTTANQNSYSVDILYGTISNFQHDYLKDASEGLDIRKKRKFDQVILDEIDTILVHHTGGVVKLAASYPGMEYLKYIYVRIWQELHKAVKAFVEDTQTKIRQLLKNHTSKEQAKLKYESFIQETITNERRTIKMKIIEGKPTDVLLIPEHLKGFVASKLNLWVSNALYAKYDCHEHQQYRIVTNDIDERVVVPVDCLNGRVALKRTVWSSGLLQFIQLKHNLYLTSETLTSCSISNIGFMKKYHSRNVIGVTTTLGSAAEQDLMGDLYNLSFAIIPTYRQGKFDEIPGWVADDASWHVTLALEVIEKIDEKRAVLVICRTEQDLLTITADLKTLQNDKFRIREFSNDDPVKIGDVIITTNFFKLKTEQALERKGGLHVCVGFLPSTRRIEDQAFGQTSRQGNKGTAQLIIRRSEIEILGIRDAHPNLTKIKAERDKFEKESLHELNHFAVKDLDFMDQLFGRASAFFNILKQSGVTQAYEFVLRDLMEAWAFWVETKRWKPKDLDNTTPEAEFAKFVKEAEAIISGTIRHNPFNSVALAECYLENGDKERAAKVLSCIQGDSSGLSAAVHLKLFEIAVAKGEQMTQRFKKAFAQVFDVECKKESSYRSQAQKHLKEAKAALGKEIDYIEKHRDLEDILIFNRGRNLFLKHFYSRLYGLYLCDGNMDKLLEQVATGDVVDVTDKMPITANYFERRFISELSELQSIGLDTIYSIKSLGEVSTEAVEAAKFHIYGGITALTIGTCFRPAFLATKNIAGALISEGMIEVIIEMISKGPLEFNQKELAKSQFMATGIDLIAHGVSAVKQSTIILMKATEFCRGLSLFLRQDPSMRELRNKLAETVDKLEESIERDLVTARFDKMTETGQLKELSRHMHAGNLKKFNYLGGLDRLRQLENDSRLTEITRMELLSGAMKNVCTDTVVRMTNTIVDEEVIVPLLSDICAKLTRAIGDDFKELLGESIRKRQVLMDKFQTSEIRQINALIDESQASEEITHVAKIFVINFLNRMETSFVDVLFLNSKNIVKPAEVAPYVDKFVGFFESALGGSLGNGDNGVDAIIEDVCREATNKIYSLFCGFLKEVRSNIESSKQLFGDRSSDKLRPDSVKAYPYSTLGLPTNAPIKSVKRNYRIRVLEFHPDRNPNDPYALDKFHWINKAFEQILKRNRFAWLSCIPKYLK